MRYLKRLQMTDGEQSFLLALLGVAFFGAGISFMIVNQLGGGDAVLRPLSAYDIWTIVAGSAGSVCALIIARDWFGHPGLRGVMYALGGMVVVSFLAPLIGGTFALPFYGTMFGPFTLLVTMIGAPLLAMFWASILLSAHILLLIWRRERDSIFAPANQETGLP